MQWCGVVRNSHFDGSIMMRYVPNSSVKKLAFGGLKFKCKSYETRDSLSLVVQTRWNYEVQLTHSTCNLTMVVLQR